MGLMFVIIPQHSIITGHTGEKARAGEPAELIEREGVHSQRAPIKV